jgi:hypothetical protein
MIIAGIVVLIALAVVLVFLVFGSLEARIHAMKDLPEPVSPAEAYAREVADAAHRTGALFQQKKYVVIHCPASGCPKGYHLLPGVFKRGDQQFDGCIHLESVASSIDFLLPGESISIEVTGKEPTE